MEMTNETLSRSGCCGSQQIIAGVSQSACIAYYSLLADCTSLYCSCGYEWFGISNFTSTFILPRDTIVLNHTRKWFLVRRPLHLHQAFQPLALSDPTRKLGCIDGRDQSGHLDNCCDITTSTTSVLCYLPRSYDGTLHTY